MLKIEQEKLEVEQKLEEQQQKNDEIEGQQAQYQNRIDVFEDVTKNFDYNLQEIVLDLSGLRVESNFDEGAPSGGEVASNVISRDNSEHKKWFVQDFKSKGGKAKLTIYFEKPILIRGYGIKSANDYPDRDPRDWLFSAVNFVKAEANQKKEKFYKLSDIKKVKFHNRWDLQKFNINPTLASAINIDFTEGNGSSDLQIGEVKLYC